MTTAFEASLEAAAARGGDLTALVHDRLFDRHPALRGEFWRDGNGAVRGEMLAQLFETLIDLAGPRRSAALVIASEVTTHDAYGISRQHFAEFFDVVCEAVEIAAGPDWTPAMAGAWQQLLGEVRAVLAA